MVVVVIGSNDVMMIVMIVMMLMMMMMAMHSLYDYQHYYHRIDEHITRLYHPIHHCLSSRCRSMHCLYYLHLCTISWGLSILHQVNYDIYI